MITHARLEAYLRRAAALSYEVEERGPFVLYFNPHDPLRFFNYAKPLVPFPENQSFPEAGDALADLIAAFEARGRLPRFEFMEEHSPGLAAILSRAGFAEEARQSFMVCEAKDFRPVEPPPGVVMRALTSDSPVAEMRAQAIVQAQGFSDDDMATADISDDAEVDRWGLQMGANGRYDVLAWWGNQPVGAASCTALLDGLSELVGVATPPRFRRRGIGTAMAAATVAAQFAAGAEAVILTAGDAAAGRIYARVGFRPFGTSLAYSRETPRESLKVRPKTL